MYPGSEKVRKSVRAHGDTEAHQRDDRKNHRDGRTADLDCATEHDLRGVWKAPPTKDRDHTFRALALRCQSDPCSHVRHFGVFRTDIGSVLFFLLQATSEVFSWSDT